MENYIVYTKPNCHSCEEMKSLITATGRTYKAINMLELPTEEIKDLRTWAKSVGQMSMPIVRDSSGELITNHLLEKALREE